MSQSCLLTHSQQQKISLFALEGIRKKKKNDIREKDTALMHFA
jgi:hypothetical protein